MKKEAEIELKKCPFCGGNPHFGYNSGAVTHVYCVTCGAQSGYTNTYDAEVAAAKWNVRIDATMTYKIGDMVRIRAGAKWGGYVLDDKRLWRVIGLGAPEKSPYHAYNVQVQLEDNLFHVWIKPEDVIEVVS